MPGSPGQIVRCALESLALSYRRTLEQLETLTGRTLKRLHIVGGGSHNALLNQFAANATGRTVLAGPAEATAIGNLLLQAVTLGHLDSLTDLRRTSALPSRFRRLSRRTALPGRTHTRDFNTWRNRNCD